MSYEPRGKMVDLMATLREQPKRLFAMKEVAEILHCKPYPSTIDQYLYAAIGSGCAFRINVRGEWLYAGSEVSDEMLVASGRAPRDNTGLRTFTSPFTEEDRQRLAADPRAPGPAGFIPKPMTPPRPGSELNIPKFNGHAVVAGKREEKSARIQADIHSEMEPRGERANRTLVDKLKSAMPHWQGDASVADANDLGKRTTSAATASSHEIPDSASTPEAAKAAGQGQEQHRDAQQNAVTAERCDEVANEGDARAASGGCAQTEREEEEEEVAEFNAAFWLDGDIVIYGVPQNEDGSFTLTTQQFRKLVQLVVLGDA